MKTIKARYEDDYKHSAIIEKITNIKGYYDDPFRKDSYRLCIYSDFNNGLLTYVNLFENFFECEYYLLHNFNGTYKRIERYL